LKLGHHLFEKKHISGTPLIRYRLIHTELWRNPWRTWFELLSVVIPFVDRDVVPQEKLLGIYELQKFAAKYISERMFSILYEIDLRNLLTSTMIRWSVGDVGKTRWSASFNWSACQRRRSLHSL